MRLNLLLGIIVAGMAYFAVAVTFNDEQIEKEEPLKDFPKIFILPPPPPALPPEMPNHNFDNIAKYN